MALPHLPRLRLAGLPLRARLRLPAPRRLRPGSRGRRRLPRLRLRPRSAGASGSCCRGCGAAGLTDRPRF
eukprot:162791-Alexandrium_andersonii.AAC.1